VVTPAPSSFDPASRIGTVVAGKYRIERLLGAGGMGAVFEAVHTGVQRRFAVKVMTADPTRSPEAVRRFTQEAQAAGLIGHPHIVEVFDLGEAEDGTLYMVMELLRGETLHAVLRRGPLPQSDAVTIALELLRALDAAHRAGIVHRDVKPQNLFLAERATGGIALKVLDFGIAKFHETENSTITRSGSIVGTPLYMAPEQVLSDREIDGRADVWAAGASLFEMLTGRPVHLAPHAAAAAVRIVTEPAPRVRTLRSDVSEELEAIVARALTIAREQRYESAGAMIAALEDLQQRLPPSEASPLVTPTPVRGSAPSANALRVTPPTPPPVSSPELRKSSTSARSGLLIFAALALVGGAAAGTLLMPMPGTRTPGAPSMAPSMAGPAREAFAEPATPPTVAATPTTATVPSATTSSLPQIASVSVSAAPPTASVSAPVGRPPTKRHDTKPHGDEKPVAATSSVAETRPPTPACGPREVMSSGHCCPIGMVWSNDHCDRPLATGL
jgi:serine/threonine-protein kinase